MMPAPANFGELRLGEVRRIHLPRTPVHTAPSGPVCEPFPSAASCAALGVHYVAAEVTTKSGKTGTVREHARRQEHGARDGAIGGCGRRRNDRGEGEHHLQVVQRGEAALLEDRLPLAHKEGGSGGLPEGERASQDARWATGLLL